MPDLISSADVLGFISYGWGPSPWFFVMPFIWIGVVFLFIWLVRGRGGWGPPRGYYRGGPSAMEILDRRFAEGEVSAEEYRERRQQLSGTS